MCTCSLTTPRNLIASKHFIVQVGGYNRKTRWFCTSGTLLWRIRTKLLNDFAFVFVTPILGRDVDWKYLKILHLQVVLVLLPSWWPVEWAARPSGHQSQGWKCDRKDLMTEQGIETFGNGCRSRNWECALYWTLVLLLSRESFASDTDCSRVMVQFHRWESWSTYCNMEAQTEATVNKMQARHNGALWEL